MKNAAPLGENLLRHFFVSHDIEQEVLGDLFQDWNIHTQEAGLGRANIRYLRQAVSLIPHLLRCWLQRVDRFEAAKTVFFVVALFALVGYWTVLEHSTKLFVTNFGLTMLSASAPGANANPIFVDWAGIAVAVSAISTVYAIGAGIVAGALCGRASMIAVVWLSLIWAVASPIYVLSSMPDQWPSWYLATYPIGMVSGTIAGGCVGALLRARLVTRRTRHVA
jgi:hypothetical protein